MLICKYVNNDISNDVRDVVIILTDRVSYKP